MQRIRPGQVVASRRVTVTSSGKIKARRNPKKDAIEKSVDKTPFGPLIGALDFGKKGGRKKAKKAKARKARNTRKRNLFGFGKPKLSKAQKRRIELEEYAKVGKLPEWRKREIEREERARFRNSAKRKARNAKMSRFDRCVKSVTERGGSYDARAVCASAGRRKYGKKKFQAMAKAGKARAARKRARRSNPYQIEPVRFTKAGKTVFPEGYSYHDYLPGYKQNFSSRKEAQAYIRENHEGKDSDGVNAVFKVVKV